MTAPAVSTITNGHRQLDAPTHRWPPPALVVTAIPRQHDPLGDDHDKLACVLVRRFAEALAIPVNLGEDVIRELTAELLLKTPVHGEPPLLDPRGARSPTHDPTSPQPRAVPAPGAVSPTAPPASDR